MSCAIEAAAVSAPGFQVVSQDQLLLHHFAAQEKQQQQRQTSEQTRNCAPFKIQTTAICDKHDDHHHDDQLLIINTPKCSTFTPAADQRTVDSTPSAISCILRKQRQQQQQPKQHQCQATRDSLESLHSRASSSSATPDAGSPEVRPASVLVASRYVEPPCVDDSFNSINSVGGKGVGSMLRQQEDFGRDTPTSTTPHQTSPVGPAHHRHDECQASLQDGAFKRGRKSLGTGSVSSGFNSLGGGGGGGVGPEERRAQQPRQIGKVEAPFMFAGILGSILGSFFFSIGMLCIKLLPDGHGLVDKNKFVCFRGVVMLLLCTISMVWRRTTFLVRRDELLINALRSIFGFAGVFGAYISLKYISMGDSTALVFSSPVWTSLLSHFILHEPLQWIQLMALPASLVGIILIAHPALLINMEHTAGYTERQPSLDLAESLASEQLPMEMLVGPLETLRNGSLTAAPGGPEVDQAILQVANETAQYVANHTSSLMHSLNSDLDISTNASEHFDFEHRWKGIVIALGTSFIVSLVYIVLKFRKTTPIQTTTFWLAVTTVSLSLLLMSFIGFGEWPSSWQEWTLILCNGLCSWLGQVLLQWAMSYEDASVLSVIRTLDVAMTFSLSAAFLKEEILWTSILGASIIAAVVVSMMLNTWLTKKLCPSGEAGQLQVSEPPPSVNGGQILPATLKSLEAGSGQLRQSSVAA